MDEDVDERKWRYPPPHELLELLVSLLLVSLLLVSLLLVSLLLVSLLLVSLLLLELLDNIMKRKMLLQHLVNPLLLEPL